MMFVYMCSKSMTGLMVSDFFVSTVVLLIEQRHTLVLSVWEDFFCPHYRNVS